MKRLFTLLLIFIVLDTSAQNCNLLSQLNADGTYTLSPGSASPGTTYMWYHDSLAITNGSSVTGSQGCYYFMSSNSGGQTCVSNVVCIPNNACASNQAAFTMASLGLNAVFTNTSAAPPAGSSLIGSYIWDFGDGSADTLTNPTHNYNAASNYTVKLVSNWYDAQTNLLQCSDTFISVVNITSCSVGIDSVRNTNGTFTLTDTTIIPGASYQWIRNANPIVGAQSNSLTIGTSGCYFLIVALNNSSCSSNPICTISPACALETTGFTYSISNNQASFTNISTGIYTSLWDFGDLSTSVLANPIHTYSWPGTYNVRLITSYADNSGTVQCIDTTSQVLTIVSNAISGNIIIDSNAYTADDSVYKVWLIAYDSAVNTLNAVDSQLIINTSSYITGYSFLNEPSGNYYVKAEVTSAPVGTSGPIPTYAASSLYWNTASLIAYSGGSAYADIIMQNGINTGGPGFVGGSIFSGANKGTHTTGVPAPGITVLLEDANNKPVAYTITDANGNYTFSNLALGTYRVYPEVLAYETTPWASINVTASGADNINFNQHTVSKTITPAPSGIVSVSAAEEDLHIFPNPAKGIVNITWNKVFNNTHVTVMDILGRKTIETDLNLITSEGRTHLDLSALESGVYFITVKGDDLNYNSKLVIQK